MFGFSNSNLSSNTPCLHTRLSKLHSLRVFSFLPKHVHFISKNTISCLFLKNVSPSKRVICFILNNLHFPMVEGITFYALHKSRVLIIKQMAFVYLQGYQMKFKNVAWYRCSLQNLIFSLFYRVTLRKHFIIKACIQCQNNFKTIFFFCYKNKCSKFEFEKVAIWQAILLNKW